MTAPKKDTRDIPPLLLWRDSGKAAPGPSELQRLYWIDKMPPSKRPHWHAQDVLVSIGAYGSGKSFKKDTEVLMYDGSIKKIQDVVVGDLLMGPDSTPRKVLDLGRGREVFYKVTPNKGDPFYCNESHILSLKRACHTPELKKKSDGSYYRRPNPRYPNQEIVNVSIVEYLTWSQRKKSCYKLYRSECIDFGKKEELPIDPYFLGLWLGDGTASIPEITNVDQPIINYIKEYVATKFPNLAIKENLRTTTGVMTYRFSRCGNSKSNDLTNLLREINVLNNKHIPLLYKTASIKDRQQLLAGLVDSDGNLHCGHTVITQKSRQLAEDIAYVARSLGLAAYVKEFQGSCIYKGQKRIGTYYRVSISGDLSSIPTKLDRKKAAPRRQIKNHLTTKFTLERLEEDDYYGVVITGDRLFLLADFTVVHNTYGAVARIVDTCAKYPGTRACIGGIDLQLLKRNVIGIIKAMCTLEKEWDHPAVVNSLTDKQTILRFSNGSELMLVNLTDFLKVVGVSLDIMDVEEPHLLPQGEESYNTLISRLRSGTIDVPQLILCTNPEKSREAWMNQTFELRRFKGIDTSKAPVQILVGKPCQCQICIRCKISSGGRYEWVRGYLSGDLLKEDESSDNYYCPECKTRKDFWTWKGKKYHCPGNQQYIRVVKSESTHNPHCPDSVLQAMDNQYDEFSKQIYLKGATDMDSREGFVYTDYIEERNKLEEQTLIDWTKDVYWGLDFNFSPQCSVVCQIDKVGDEEKALVAKEEIVMYGPTMEQPYGGARVIDVAKEFVRRFKEPYNIASCGVTVYIGGDPKGFIKSESDLNRYEIIYRYLTANGFKVEMLADDLQISVKDRIENVNQLLRDGRFFVNPHFTDHLLKSLQDSKWKDHKSLKPEVDKSEDFNAARSKNRGRIYLLSHPTEAVGYLIYKLFPLFAGLGAPRSAYFSSGKAIREDIDAVVEIEHLNAPEATKAEEVLEKINDLNAKAAIAAKADAERLKNLSLNQLLNGMW